MAQFPQKVNSIPIIYAHAFVQIALDNIRTRSTWDKGVKYYANWILEKRIAVLSFNGYVNDHELLLTTEKDLLCGAKNWNQASCGGAYETDDYFVAKKLCTPTEFKRKKYGKLPPNSRESWLDVQGRALAQAAQMVLKVIREVF